MVFYFTGTGNSLYIAKQIEAAPVTDADQAAHQQFLARTSQMPATAMSIFLCGKSSTPISKNSTKSA